MILTFWVHADPPEVNSGNDDAEHAIEHALFAVGFHLFNVLLLKAFLNPVEELAVHGFPGNLVILIGALVWPG